MNETPGSLLGQPPIPTYRQLAEVSIETVASIAAHLPTNISPPDAVKRAYELLEWAVVAREGLIYHRSYEKGIERGKRGREFLADTPKDITPRGEDGEYLFDENGILPVDLDKALASFWPGKTVKRLPLFKKWLIDTFSWDQFEAEKQVEIYRREKMPWGVYNAARLFVCDWRNKSISKVRSEAGKKGQEAKRASKEGQATINTKKKGKQGRVKKQTDKRLGSQVDKKIIGKRKKRPLT